MKVKDMREIIKDLDDDVEIEVNSVLDEDRQKNVYRSSKHFFEFT